jgi:hypothetical protein
MKQHKENYHMKEKETRTDKRESPVVEMAELAMKNYQQAFRTGLKLQEEAGRFWSNLLNQTSPTFDNVKRFNYLSRVANELSASAQERSEELLGLVEQNGRIGLELGKKAYEAVRTTVIAESHAKWLDFYKTSLDTMRQNAETVTQITSRAFDSYINFVRKNAETRATSA